jgi:hypothetical protein
MFKIRKAEEIVQNMIDYTQGQNTELTDFSVGSKSRTAYEAIANIVEELYYRLWQGAKAIIEEQIYKIFDFGSLPATKSAGTATFSRVAAAVTDILIAAGTKITTATQETLIPVIYETTVDATLLTGTTSVTVNIRAVVEGAYANVAAAKLTVLQTSVAAIDAVTNGEPIMNGTDAETPEARKQRFKKYTGSLSQGTNDALKYGAEQVVGVFSATTRENPTLTFLAFSGSSSVFTDNSYEANYPWGTPFSMLPTNPVNGDMCYVGAFQKFDFLYVRMPATYTVGTGVWEYWNGSAWVALTATDGTTGMSKSGLLTFTMPSDWRDVKVSTTWAFWIRFRVTNTWTQNPQMHHMFASPPPGYVDVYIQDINATASTALIASVATALARFRGSGITINIRAPQKTLLAVSCAIKINTTYDSTLVLNTVVQTITDHLNAFVLGQNFVHALLENEILNLDQGGGYMVQSITTTLPTSDRLANPGEIFRPDTANIVVSVVN